METCNWGKVDGAVVPSVTLGDLGDRLTGLGKYRGGFWRREDNRLPFSVQSWKGQYVSPPDTSLI